MTPADLAADLGTVAQAFIHAWPLTIAVPAALVLTHTPTWITFCARFVEGEGIVSDQLDLLDLLPAPELTGIKHVCFPDFSLACGLGYLEKPKGDRVHLGRPKRWADVTCDWCRSLGRAYCSYQINLMQRRAA